MIIFPRAITRELPEHYPFIVTHEYIASFTAQWHVPTRNYFDHVVKVLLAYVKNLIQKHFNKFAHGGLQAHIT